MVGPQGTWSKTMGNNGEKVEKTIGGNQQHKPAMTEGTKFGYQAFDS